MKNADMPAMPLGAATVSLDNTDEAARGLTKREHFAAMAMQGLLASGPHDCDQHGIAHDAILQADALLAKLERR